MLYEQIQKYVPVNEQEQADQKAILDFMKHYDNVLSRVNQIAHFSASGWTVNKDRNKVLMIYHNLYNSWAWTGGHADGEENLLNVALRELTEESGIQTVKPITYEICSMEILTVDGHIKHGAYVPSHLHLNVTYLLEADDREELIVKPDENSGVKWFSTDDVLKACSEPWMHQIYRKLLCRMKEY
ncbi:MAG: NUDIX hydrolase [Clostridiales bacterium]|nr:NUDIX hydrolase [Clostridiales bacterium]